MRCETSMASGSHRCPGVDSDPSGRPGVGRGSGGMGKATNAAVTARARTRGRRIATDVDGAARGQRLDVAAAEVHRARAVIEAARERAALAVAAARAAEREEVAGAEAAINGAVRRLSGEGLTIAQVADLVGMTGKEVRRILRTTSKTLQTPLA